MLEELLRVQNGRTFHEVNDSHEGKGTLRVSELCTHTSPLAALWGSVSHELALIGNGIGVERHFDVVEEGL